MQEESTAVVEDQMVLTLDRSNRDFVTEQLETMARHNAVRLRLREERGINASLYVIDLRADKAALDTFKHQLQVLLAQQTVAAGAAKRLPRPVILGLSFVAGMLGILVLRLIAGG